MNTNIEQFPLSLSAGLAVWVFLVVLIIILTIVFGSRKSTPKQPQSPQSKLYSQATSPGNMLIDLNTTKYRYLKRNHIMSSREERFFTLLCEIFSDRCHVIPQVHLSKLLNHKVQGQNWRGAFSHINGKSVDFVLLRKSDLTVLCAIELDDWSHDLMDRRERDEVVEGLFRSVRLPLVRFRYVNHVTKQDVVNRVAEAIRNT